MILFLLRIWRIILVVVRNIEISRGFGVFIVMLCKEDVVFMRRNYEMFDGFDEFYFVVKEFFM